MRKFKALHIASFNGNIGDNANHNGFRRRLTKQLDNEIIFTNVEMREFYKSWNVRGFNSEEFINLCNSHDLVIIGGGNFFELKWDYSCTGTTININNQTLDRIKVPILFQGLGCDIAKGASEDAIEKFGMFLERITNDEKILVSVRNDGSYGTINKLYGDKFNDKVYIVPDGAFFMESKKYDFPEINSVYKSIGINVAADMKDIRFDESKPGMISYDGFITGFTEEINGFLGKHRDYQIIFFPHIYSDLAAIYDLLEKIDDRFRRTRVVTAPCLTGKGAEEYIFGLYKECEFIMGMRFHSNVCSIAQNIPTIALSSYRKILDLYSGIDLHDRVVEVNKYGFEQTLRNLIEQTVIESDLIKNRYEKVNDKILSESKEFYESIEKWFKGM